MGATNTHSGAKRRTIVIEVDYNSGNYQESLLDRLREYGITQREVVNEIAKAGEITITESQFSRWVARPSAETGDMTNMRFGNVFAIEKAIVNIRARREAKVKRVKVKA